MTGVVFQLTTTGLDPALFALRQLGGFEMARLADGVGAILESGARGRIAEEKAGPDGAAWDPWSERYDETREERHSLLVAEGSLLDSIAFFATGDEVVVGSNLVYAATHQMGGVEGTNIPARPYLGMSGDEERDIRDLVTGRLREVFA